ncbi:MAG TPA: hypothetical protein VJR27_04925 [Candidatus Saccharimonadales bacterium]|nr:hypothetical protein [Candidatus Saccharimonadales bacterium]
MSETSASNTPDNPIPDQLPPFEGNLDDEALRTNREEAEDLRAAYGGWLERRGIDPASTPHLTMGRREFDLFRNAPQSYQDYTRELYGIPGDDQANCQYALVEIGSDDPNPPHDPVLTMVTEADFGTTIDREVIDKDFQTPDQGPHNPEMPNRSGGALKTVDIANTLATSAQGLETFTAELMNGKTTDPLSSHYGDIGVRAGGLASGQKDAYVWTASPFAKSVELTLAFPSQYDSVCVVRGQRREAANGKAGMAQIDDPTEVLKIEGENLRELQRIYQDLYHEPDFALTEEQRRGRDELFNDYLAHKISREARNNRDQEQARQDYHQPQLRAREIPRS